MRFAAYFTILGYSFVYLLDQGISSKLSALTLGVFTFNNLIGKLGAGLLESRGVKNRVTSSLSGVLMGASLLVLLVANSTITEPISK